MSERDEMDASSPPAPAYELDRDTALEAVAEHVYRTALTDRWSIGAVPNGGYVLAAVIGAMGRSLPHPDPITVTAHYLRPTLPTAATIHVEILKRGSRFATAAARLEQEGSLRVAVLGTFGTIGDERTPPRFQDGMPPPLPPRDTCVASRPAGATPAIAERFDMALDPDCLAFMRGETREHAVMRGHLRFRDGRPLDPQALAVVADAFPPPAFNVIAPGWVPTVELTVHFRARPVGSWLRCAFQTRFLFGGQLEEDGEIWDERDQLVAQSRQLAILPTGA